MLEHASWIPDFEVCIFSIAIYLHYHLERKEFLSNSNPAFEHIKLLPSIMLHLLSHFLDLSDS